MTLILPPGVLRQQAEAREAHNAEVMADVALLAQLRKWNAELKQIDPYLELVKAAEDTLHPSLTPGYFHVIRRPPGGAVHVICHQGPNGEFREPDSGLFRELAEGDMWNDKVRHAREKRQKELRKAQEREEEREAAERVEELKDRCKAAWSPGVRIRDLPWTSQP